MRGVGCFVAALLLAGPALAGACPMQVSGVVWDDEGTSVDSLQERQGDVVSVWSETPLYAVGRRLHAGLIPLEIMGVDGPMVYDWQTPLPGLDQLVAGAGFRLEGSLRAGEFQSAVAMDLKVIGPAELMVGNCPLKVLKLQRTEWEDGVANATFTVLLHLPSLLIVESAAVMSGGAPARETALALR